MTNVNTARERIHIILRRCDVIFVEDAIPLLSETERDQLKADLIESGVPAGKLRALFEPLERLETARRWLINEGGPA